MADYAIKVVRKNGENIFICDDVFRDVPTRYPSYAAAYRQVESLKAIGSQNVQSINIVKYPKRRSA
jgi:hypothetical protein